MIALSAPQHKAYAHSVGAEVGYSLTVTSGPLSFAPLLDPRPGPDGAHSFDKNITVIDARSSGLGWSLVISVNDKTTFVTRSSGSNQVRYTIGSSLDLADPTFTATLRVNNVIVTLQ